MKTLARLLAGAPLLCVLLAGCAADYDPPAKGDHTAPKYQADLLKCHKQVNLPAGRAANATVGKSIQSLFKSDEPQRQAIAACMQSKGYMLP